MINKDVESRFDQIRGHLPKPVYESDRCLLYHGDCIELLALLPPAVLDLTITSPPYNIGKEYESVMPLPNYIEWCANWMQSIHRATTCSGAFWLNLGYVSVEGKGKAVPLPYLLWNLSNFFLQQEVVWNYGAGVSAKHSFCPRNEKLLWYVKDPKNYAFNLDAVRDPDVKYPNQKKNGKLKCNPLGKNPSDVWQIPKVTSGADRSSVERTPHPAQFPNALIERIILACSAPGDIILDPFMGSGTVADVATRCNRRVIGFEIRQDYVAIQMNRLKERQGQLFSETESGVLIVRETAAS